MRIVFHKKMKNYEQALFEIDTAYRNLLDKEPDHIKNMSEFEIIDMYQTDHKINAEKVVVVAELLREEAEIRELKEGFNHGILNTVLKSFLLYIEAILCDKNREFKFQMRQFYEIHDSVIENLMSFSV
jgi:hypothetical protein